MYVPSAVTANHLPLDIYSGVDFLQDFSVINIPQPPRIPQTNRGLQRWAITDLY